MTNILRGKRDMKKKDIIVNEEEFYTRLVTITQQRVNELEKKCDELQEYYYSQVDAGFSQKYSPRLIEIEKNIQYVKGKDQAYIEMLLQYVKIRDKLIKKRLLEEKKNRKRTRNNKCEIIEQ